MSLSGVKQKRLSYVCLSYGTAVEGALNGMVKKRFSPIDRAVQVASTGWVDPLCPTGDPAELNTSHFNFNTYIYGTVRCDAIQIPPTALRMAVDHRIIVFLEETGFSRVSRNAKRHLIEEARHELSQRAIPKTTFTEVVLSSDRGRAFTTSKSLLGAVEALVEEICDQPRTVTYPAIAYEMLSENVIRDFHAIDIMDGTLGPPLEYDSKWLGREFLTWLCFKSHEGDGAISLGGETIQYYPVGNVTLAAKSKVVTVKDEEAISSDEVSAALKDHALIDRMGFALESGSARYEGVLGSLHFGVRSLLLPAFVSREGSLEPADVFEGNMVQIERFDDIHAALFLAYLDLRASDGWEAERERLRAWICDE